MQREPYVRPADHLAECPGCEECDHLMSLYTACDECGHWMNNECEHYYEPDTGVSLCFCCEPKDDPL